jgi:hypothetical protein
VRTVSAALPQWACIQRVVFCCFSADDLAVYRSELSRPAE